MSRTKLALLAGYVSSVALLGGAMAIDERAAILAFAALAATSALAAPTWSLLAIAFIVFRWRPESVVANLAIADLALLAYVARSVHLIGRTKVAPWMMSLGAFLVVAWASTLLSGVSTTPLMRITLYGATGVAVARQPRDRPYVLTMLVAQATLIVAISSVTQAGQRMFGETIGDPQQLGILLLAAIAAVASGEVGGRYRPWLLAAFTWGIVATQTRGVWLAYLVMILVLAARRMSRRRLLVSAAAVAAAGFVLYAPVTTKLGLNPASQEYRAQSIRAGIEAARSRPVLGVGWAGGTSDPGAPLTVPYNVLVLVALYTGLVGLVCFIVFASRAAGRMVRNGDRTCFGFFSGFVAISMSEPTFYAGSMVTLLFFVFVGLANGQSRPVSKIVNVTPMASTASTTPTNTAIPRLDTARS